MIEIYLLTHKVTGRQYVGSTVNLKKRFRAHVSALRKGKHENAALQAAWTAAPDCFAVSVVACTTSEHRHMVEQAILDTLDNPYNMALLVTKPGLGFKLSAETKQKMRTAKLGKPGPNNGKRFSAETRQKMSESAKGKPKPWRKNVSRNEKGQFNG